MTVAAHRLTPTRRRLRLARQTRPLCPVLRQSRLTWYRALAQLILGLLAVFAAAVVIAKVVPWT